MTRGACSGQTFGEGALAHDFVVASQPIFSKNLDIFAHELLFRKCSDDDVAVISDFDDATNQMIADGFSLATKRLGPTGRVSVNVGRGKHPVQERPGPSRRAGHPRDAERYGSLRGTPARLPGHQGQGIQPSCWTISDRGARARRPWCRSWISLRCRFRAWTERGSPRSARRSRAGRESWWLPGSRIGRRSRGASSSASIIFKGSFSRIRKRLLGEN